jgi:hypothetical protein
LRPLAGFLAFILVADPIVGISAWIHVRKAIVKHEVRRHIISGLDKNGLVLLEFKKPESETLLRWEHSREFEFNGQMYDIVESWTVGDTVYYRCWWDRAETRLNNLLRELAVRSFGDAPKVGDRERSRHAPLESSVFLLTDAWKLPPPPSPSGLLGRAAEWRPSRNPRPETPPPWPA